VTSDTPTIEEFGRRLRAREMSAVEMTDECLKRIDADNRRLNAFILVMTDEARRQARDADRELAAGRDRGPLHGVPVSVKDLFDIRGTATSAASLVREGHIADRDAAAGIRIDPPVSVPKAASAMPAARLAAEPPLDPPGDRVES